MKRWLNPEREARIIELYEKYETTREVADELGVSDETVRRALKKHGIKRTHRHEMAKKKSDIVSHSSTANVIESTTTHPSLSKSCTSATVAYAKSAENHAIGTIGSGGATGQHIRRSITSCHAQRAVNTSGITSSLPTAYATQRSAT